VFLRFHGHFLPPLFSLTGNCTSDSNTDMLPFAIAFQPGMSLYEQVIYAAKKAIVSGQMQPGQVFPSVRTLSVELKINPNTAHKVITHLLEQGLLEVRQGAGTFIAEHQVARAGEKARLINQEAEKLAVEGKRLGLSLAEVTAAVIGHWQELEAHSRKGGGKNK
jgi:GntR family transcriptional regulator